MFAARRLYLSSSLSRHKSSTSTLTAAKTKKTSLDKKSVKKVIAAAVKKEDPKVDAVVLPNLPQNSYLYAHKSDVGEDTENSVRDTMATRLELYEMQHVTPLLARLKPFPMLVKRRVTPMNDYFASRRGSVHEEFKEHSDDHSEDGILRARAILEMMRAEFRELSKEEQSSKYGKPDIIATVDPKKLRQRIMIPPPKISVKPQNYFVAEQFEKIKAGEGFKSVPFNQQLTQLHEQFDKLSGEEKEKYTNISGEITAKNKKVLAYYQEHQPVENMILCKLYKLQTMMKKYNLQPKFKSIRKFIKPVKTIPELEQIFEDYKSGKLVEDRKKRNQSASGYRKFMTSVEVPKGAGGKKYIGLVSKQWSALSDDEKKVWNDQAKPATE